MHRLLAATAIVGLLAGLAGCHTTVTQNELDDIVSKSKLNREPPDLILERSSRDYDYYRIETGSSTIGRYRVERTTDY